MWRVLKTLCCKFSPPLLLLITETWLLGSHIAISFDLTHLEVAGHKKYKDSMWRCQACDWEVKEDQEHLMVCDGYQDLQGDADMGNEADLVEFYSRVIERRKEKKWD